MSRYLQVRLDQSLQHADVQNPHMMAMRQRDRGGEPEL